MPLIFFASNSACFVLQVGQSVRARVLWVDIPKQTVALTLKPSLLAEELVPLTSYQQAEVGKAYVGVVRVRTQIQMIYLGKIRFNNI